MKLYMQAPADVAAFIADILAQKTAPPPLTEIVGHDTYTAADMAAGFGRKLGRTVTAVQTPRDQWKTTLEQVGFSPPGARNLALMTEATIHGKTRAEGDVQSTETTFAEYLKQVLDRSGDS